MCKRTPTETIESIQDHGRITSLISYAGLPPNQVEIAHAQYTLVVGDLGIESP
jgi:hypothetical protein